MLYLQRYSKMEDKAIKIFDFLRNLTTTKGGILILGIILGCLPFAYISYYERRENERLQAENVSLKNNLNTDIEDCAKKLLELKKYMNRLKNEE